ncbi:hypothetical protein DPMN_079988 [Dreissena polymorpha]|uniref:Uncharacterized protein n=1 Tax=Dreissena polymorpha TaxID=45954 RepID=A0A9D4BTG1_DREPO|nr:hypothetical protein DPMN_079988 [Dreissena polymorpha]
MRPHFQHSRRLSRYRRDKGHCRSSHRRSRTPRSPWWFPSYSLMESQDSFPRVSVPQWASTHVSANSTVTGPNLSTNKSSFNSQAPGSGVHLAPQLSFQPHGYLLRCLVVYPQLLPHRIQIHKGFSIFQ